MQDLGGYGITAQSFEFLCTLDPNGIGHRAGTRAPSGRPNADGTVWTFNLRQNVKWQKDGAPFTADDVVATMERLVAAGNSGLKGVLAAGGAVATDANDGHVHARGRQRQLPVPRLGLQRPDADHAEGLRRRDHVRQGAERDRRLEAQDVQPAEGATFERNPDWWGGRRRSTAPSSSSSTPPARWSPPTRASRSTPSSSSTSCPARRSSTTRTSASSPPRRRSTARSGCAADNGQFKDKHVRQALAYTFDRPALIQQLFKGKAELGNDHVIWQGYPYFDPSVPQRAQDIAKAKQLLSDAGVDEPDGGPSTAASCSRSLTSPRSSRARPPRRASPSMSSSRASTRSMAPSGARPSRPTRRAPALSELGIVDYGHRATPGRLPERGAQVQGHLELRRSTPRRNSTPRSRHSRPPIGVDAQKAACTKIETILVEDTPIGLPYFYNYLAGNSKQFTGVYSSALGQMFFSAASKTPEITGAGPQSHRRSRAAIRRSGVR